MRIKIDISRHDAPLRLSEALAALPRGEAAEVEIADAGLCAYGIIRRVKEALTIPQSRSETR